MVRYEAPNEVRAPRIPPEYSMESTDYSKLTYRRLPLPNQLRRMGSMLDVIKHTMLTQLIKQMQSFATAPLTYIDYNTGRVSYKINRSLHRTWGVDSAYEYGRWFSRLAHISKHSYQHSFVPYFHSIRLHNASLSSKNVNSTSSSLLPPRLPRNFELYPGHVSLVSPYLRSYDRSILFEPESDTFQALLDHFNGNRKVSVYRYDAYGNGGADSVRHLMKPITSRALVHLNIGQGEQYESVKGQLIRIGAELLPQMMKQFPHATIMCSYPLYSNLHQNDFVQSFVATGARHILHTHWFAQTWDDVCPGQSLGPDHADRLRMNVDEPWGVGVIVVKPPAGFDSIVQGLLEDVDDVYNHVGVVDHNGILQKEVVDDLVVSRTEEEEKQLDEELVQERAVVGVGFERGWENADFDRPKIAWLTPRHLEHVDPRESFEWNEKSPVVPDLVRLQDQVKILKTTIDNDDIKQSDTLPFYNIDHSLKRMDAGSLASSKPTTAKKLDFIQTEPKSAVLRRYQWEVAKDANLPGLITATKGSVAELEALAKKKTLLQSVDAKVSANQLKLKQMFATELKRNVARPSKE